MLGMTFERFGRLFSAGAFLIMLFIPLRAHAVAVSVDLDPGTPGIQSTLTVSAGDSFLVDIVVSDIIPPASLGGFVLALGFDASVLDATSAVDGGFLLPPVLELENNLSGGEVNFAEFTLGPSGAAGSGVLAQIGFDALTTGVSALTLNNVLLSQPFGVPILGFSLNNATVTVSAGAGTVPEPAGVFLLAIGLLGLFSAGRPVLVARVFCRAA